MFNSFMSTVMNMSADIYEQENTQNATTGAIARHWEYSYTTNCLIHPTKSDGTSTKADGRDYPLNHTYTESSQLRGKFSKPLSKRTRVSGIRSSNNEIIYAEMETYSQTPTIYEIVSCHPMLDPFGRLSHYDVIMERVLVQNNDSF